MKIECFKNLNKFNIMSEKKNKFQCQVRKFMILTTKRSFVKSKNNRNNSKVTMLILNRNNNEIDFNGDSYSFKFDLINKVINSKVIIL